jgi:hypothetical protein
MASVGARAAHGHSFHPSQSIPVASDARRQDSWLDASIVAAKAAADDAHPWGQLVDERVEPGEAVWEELPI